MRDETKTMTKGMTDGRRKTSRHRSIGSSLIPHPSSLQAEDLRVRTKQFARASHPACILAYQNESNARK